MYRRIGIGLTIMLASLAGCTQAPLPPLAAGQAASAAVEYRLDAGDKVRVTTYGEQSLSGEFEVGADGRLALPLIGDVPASGKTTSELARAIEAALANGFVQNPKVAAQLLSYRPFYILGEVNKPGSYPYTTGLTVLNAVATAEGFTYRANTKRIFVRHMNGTAEEVVPLTAATPVLPGDTIRVGERFF